MKPAYKNKENDIIIDIGFCQELWQLHLYSCNVNMVRNLGHLKKSIQFISSSYKLKSVEELLLGDCKRLEALSEKLSDEERKKSIEDQVARERSEPWFSLKELHLVKCSLRTIEPIFSVFVDVEHLNLSSNHIKRIENLQDCYALTHLNLSKNE